MSDFMGNDFCSMGLIKCATERPLKTGFTLYPLQLTPTVVILFLEPEHNHLHGHSFLNLDTRSKWPCMSKCWEIMYDLSYGHDHFIHFFTMEVFSKWSAPHHLYWTCRRHLGQIHFFLTYKVWVPYFTDSYKLIFYWSHNLMWTS